MKKIVYFTLLFVLFSSCECLECKKEESKRIKKVESIVIEGVRYTIITVDYKEYLTNGHDLIPLNQ